jgi:cytochrome b pre-mRNA-processing protein 3
MSRMAFAPFYIWSIKMSFFQHWFGNSRKDDKAGLLPLYNAIVAKGRELHWYEQGGVADSIDGRFEMITAILAMVQIRLEKQPDQAQNLVYLTELFVDDMDGQLRQIGIGDMIVGKHIGKIMAALGGRIGAYRDSINDIAAFEAALLRNLYRGEEPQADQIEHTRETLISVHSALNTHTPDSIIQAQLSW